MIFEFQVLCFIAHFHLGSVEFICPGAIYPPEGLSHVHIEPNISGRASQEYANIRIKLFHDPIIEGNPYKELVQTAADFWSHALSVKPVNGRIYIVPDCTSREDIVFKASKDPNVKEMYCLGSCATVTKCHDFEIPKEHLDGCMSCKENGTNCSKNDTTKGTGVEDADIVFYVNETDAESCRNGKRLAFAGYCEMDPILDRPLFAIINICPKQAAKFTNNDQVMLRMIKHEMMHALGFGFFMYFRDSEGKALWERDKNGAPVVENDFKDARVLKTIEREWHVRGGVIKTNRTFLVTPNVVKEAQAHFNCTDLEGAELEDFGGIGTRNSHFEARVFYDDAMRGNLGFSKGLFSRLDFAVLDDSGWYQVNYSQAEEMDFGRNLGCDFCMKSCNFWMYKNRKENESIAPYCDTPDLGLRPSFSCDGTTKVFSGCPLKNHDLEFIEQLHRSNSTDPSHELPRKYQNFDQISDVKDDEVSQWGSIDQFADFCPIPINKSAITGESNSECEMRTTMRNGNESEKNPNDDQMDANEDEEHQKSKSPHFGSSVELVSLLTCIVVMLLRDNF